MNLYQIFVLKTKQSKIEPAEDIGRVQSDVGRCGITIRFKGIVICRRCPHSQELQTEVFRGVWLGQVGWGLLPVGGA